MVGRMPRLGWSILRKFNFLLSFLWYKKSRHQERWKSERHIDAIIVKGNLKKDQSWFHQYGKMMMYTGFMSAKIVSNISKIIQKITKRYVRVKVAFHDGSEIVSLYHFTFYRYGNLNKITANGMRSVRCPYMLPATKVAQRSTKDGWPVQVWGVQDWCKDRPHTFLQGKGWSDGPCGAFLYPIG